MALSCEPWAELIDVVHYTKTIQNDNTLCLICHHDETETGDKWDRYQLKCNHKYHTRCLRRWGHIKKCVNCPLCGDVDRKNDLYCGHCDTFGHSDSRGNCPIINNEIELMMRRQREATKKPKTRGRVDKRLIKAYDHIINNCIDVF